MTFWAVLSCLAALPVPPECEAPPLHDVAPLKAFAQKSGTLSVGLDSVATWCFDSGGAWTGGQRPEAGKKPKPVDPAAPAVGDCARSLSSCEEARASLTPELVQALTDALADLERPFRGQKYVPKRSGLAERPSTAVNCKDRTRPELFAQAQARMDLARLASSVQNEYANYKTWLYARGLECGQQVRTGRVDNTKLAVSVDSPSNAGGGAALVAKSGAGGGAAGTKPTPPSSEGPSVAGAGGGAALGKGTPSAGGGAAVIVARPVGGGSALTSDPGRTGAGTTVATASAGGPGSTGSGTTTTPTANPSGTPPIGPATVAANTTTTPTGTNPSGTPPIGPGTVGTSPSGTNASGTPPIGTGSTTLPSDVPAPKNELLETWKGLAAQRGKMELDRDYTLGFLASRELRDCRCQRTSPAGVVTRLESGDGVTQLETDSPRAIACEHCLQNAFAAWRGRVQKQCALLPELSQYELEVLQKSDDGNGLPPRCLLDAYAKRGLDAGVLLAQVTPPKPPPSTGPLATATTLTVPLDPKQPPAAALQPGPTGMPRFEPTTALADGFYRPTEPAPIPLREDGRLYVRVFMSSTCAADVLPGPVLARTGDLLLIPYGARALSLRSPCGGLAEVYWGREATPRVSEVFGRNQPLHFQFKPQ